MTTWTYAGATTNDVYYGPGRWEHFSIWLSPSAPLSGAAILVSLPGGGWLPAPFQLYSREDPNYAIFGGATVVEQAAIDAGMHVVRAMYPNAGASLALQIQPARVFPHNLCSVARLLAYLKDHAADYGADPAKLCVKGSSAGGHLALLSQLIPLEIGVLPYRSPLPLTGDDRWMLSSNARVRAVIDDGGPKDLLPIDPATAGSAAKALFYAGARYANFKSLPPSAIKAASPYWWAIQDPVAAQQVAVLSNYTSSPSVDPDSWTWGVQKSGFVGIDDSAYGKAWKIWHDANIPSSAKWFTYWGQSGGSFPNPGGNIGQSGATWAATVLAWWQSLGLVA